MSVCIIQQQKQMMILNLTALFEIKWIYIAYNYNFFSLDFYSKIKFELTWITTVWQK